MNPPEWMELFPSLDPLNDEPIDFWPHRELEIPQSETRISNQCLYTSEKFRKWTIETSEKWRKGSLWIDVMLPRRAWRYSVEEIYFAKNREEFEERISDEEMIILFEINATSPNNGNSVTSLIEGNVITGMKTRILDNGHSPKVRLTFKCLKSKSDFVTGASKNRRNAQVIQTYLCATIYHNQNTTFYKKEIHWTTPPTKIEKTSISEYPQELNDDPETDFCHSCTCLAHFGSSLAIDAPISNDTFFSLCMEDDLQNN